MGGTPTILVGSARWKRFSESNLKYWLLAFNLLGVIAHGVGVGLTLGLGRHDIRLRSFRTVPINSGNETHPELSRGVERDMAFYPTWIVAVFFLLSLSFHVVISLLLILHIAYPLSQSYSVYMRCLYWNIAPWVRCCPAPRAF